MSNLFRLYRTVRHLKAPQIYYRLYYGARNKWRRWKGVEASFPAFREPLQMNLTFCNEEKKIYHGDFTFEFLNQKKRFRRSINWNFMKYGKLWNYNLLYFDYLQQTDISLEEKQAFVNDFIDRFESIALAKDPYPISLRCINWIKFLIKNDIQDEPIAHSIYYQYYLLLDNIEYHLLGNHLLENGCSLLIGGLFFDDEILLGKARDILSNQLDEQILDDGGHFERSPMYHQILLYRLLDCYNFACARPGNAKYFQMLLREKIEAMCGWLQKITFTNGDIPYVNDAAKEIAPPTDYVLAYADQLKLSPRTSALDDSGYRVIRNDSYELFIDVGDIGPDYIPGHAHSDTFSFVLHAEKKPIIVDTGVSTYEENKRRITERSTAAHNTVKINGEEQSEIWKSFRVGRRAHITQLQENATEIRAGHDGYQYLGITHQRTFEWSNRKILIRDRLKGENKAGAMAYLHFHPDVNVKKEKDGIWADGIKFTFSEDSQPELKKYEYAAGFNQLKTATLLEIRFKSALKTEILL